MAEFGCDWSTVPATPEVLALPESVRDCLVSAVPMAGWRPWGGRRLGGYPLSPAAGSTTGQALGLDDGAGLTRTGLYR